MSSPFKGVVPRRYPTSSKLSGEESFSQLKKVADAVFSKWVRKQATHNASNGMATCFTCDATALPSTMHCGHFINRDCMPLRWDARNCKCQCEKCNIELGGNLEVFRERLIYQYGTPAIEELEAKRHSLAKFNREDLRELIKKYQ